MAETGTDPEAGEGEDEEEAKLPPLDELKDAFQIKVAADGRNARLLAHLTKPRSAAELGRITGQPRQRVNYHLCLLRQADLVQYIRSRRRRGFTERLYQATASAYVVRPDALGPIAPPEQFTPTTDEDADALDHLVYFTSEDERAAFLKYVESALRQAVEHHARAAHRPGARRYRIRVAVAPVSST